MTAARSALVTGCSTGIGRATALALHARGWAVYATARRVDQLADLAERGLTVLPLDVTDEASMVAAVRRVEADHGSVGALVNNAGYAVQGPVEETPLEDLRAMFETNVHGLVRLTQLVLPGMRAAGGGRVVLMGSMGGRFTLPGGAGYHATKHAVEAVADGLRLEVAPFGVRVVLIQPGAVRTAFATTALADLPVHGGPYEGFRRDLAGRFAAGYGPASGAVGPDAVARVVVRAVEATRPRARYTVGRVARLLVGLRRVLPDAGWDALLRAVYVVPAAPSSPGADGRIPA